PLQAKAGYIDARPIDENLLHRTAGRGHERSHRPARGTLRDIRHYKATSPARDPPSLSCASSLERDFCRRRQTRQKGPDDDVSVQRPEIGDHDAREMAAKMGFLLPSVYRGFRRTGWWARQGSHF